VVNVYKIFPGHNPIGKFMRKAQPLGFRHSSPLWRYWVPPLFLSLAILVVSGEMGAASNTSSFLNWILSGWITLSSEELDLLHGWLRKAAHFLTYGVLAVLWLRALTFYWPRRPGVNLVLALTCCLVVALLDEGRQALLASRTGSLGDVFLDMTGAGILVVIAALWWKKASAVHHEPRPPFP